MSSQQLFKECIHEENLDEKLKAELKDLAEDPQELEDAFCTSFSENVCMNCDYCVLQSFNLL